jgi:hypothetical protein
LRRMFADESGFAPMFQRVFIELILDFDVYRFKVSFQHRPFEVVENLKQLL